MADVQIEAATSAVLHYRNVRLGPVWVDEDTAYVFYVNAANDLVYRKTANGGVDWGAAVAVRTGTIGRVSVWFDKWTPGDSGDLIHVAYIDIDADDVLYRNLDTSTDTLSAEKTIFAGVSADPSYHILDITKSRGGNLYCGFWIDNDGESGFYRSVDDGDNWAARAALAERNDIDLILLLPGDEADNQDIWCIYWHVGDSEISLKVYDNSGNSWAKTSISLNMTGSVAYYQMSAVQRASDNHVILAAWNLFNNAAADLKVWDIGGAGSIVAKTNVLTNSDDTIQCAAFINQQTDDIYVAYLKGSQVYISMGAYYKKSDDGGGSWGGEVGLSDDADDDLRAIWAGHSVGDEGGYFMPAWYNEDFDDLMTSTANAVAIAAAAVGIGVGEMMAAAGIGGGGLGAQQPYIEPIEIVSY